MQNYAGFKRMMTFCKTYISPELHAEIEANKPAEDLVDDEKKAADKKFKEFGVRQMTKMCKDLIDGGEKHFHFYTLNLDESTTQILKNLGLAPEDYSEETAPAYLQKAEGHPGWVA